MNINLDYVKDFLKVFDFSAGLCEKDIPDYAYLLKHEYNITVKSGVSKLVCIPPAADYVIKIPFDRYYDEGENEYYEFERAGILDEKYEWDYCAKEYMLYCFAETQGIKEAFPETIFLGMIYDWPIYAQEKCTTMAEDTTPLKKVSLPQKRKTCNFCSSKNLINPIDLSWLTLFYNLHGGENTESFLNFIHYYEIDNDLHCQNIGFSQKDNRPVIIDFSDFCEY